MIRVGAGAAKGRRLSAPRSSALRPTSAKVKEALFAVLSEEVTSANVLDLFCGVGSLGIEALSRGAARCTFVDRDRQALAYVVRNLDHTGFSDQANVRRLQLPGQLDERLGGPFDLIFSDPPYADTMADILATRLARCRNLLSPGAIWTHELASRAGGKSQAILLGWEPIDCRRYGDTTLWMYRRAAARP